MRRIWHILLLVLIPQASLADDCPRVKIKAERLPDLNIPRNSHSAVCINGEVTVFGGHTTNFIPTQTAEYFKDGEGVDEENCDEMLEGSSIYISLEFDRLK